MTLPYLYKGKLCTGKPRLHLYIQTPPPPPPKEVLQPTTMADTITDTWRVEEHLFHLIPAEFTWADYSSMKADFNLKKVGVKVHEQIYSICMIFNTRLEFDYADWG